MERIAWSGLLQHAVVRKVLYNLLLILTWYTLSTILSIYNKTLLGKENGLANRGSFPAPLLMSSVQFILQFALAKLVFGLSIVARSDKPPVSWHNYWRIVVPNGVITGFDIGFSNKSLVYITMSFYTMCKSTVPIFLLLCAFIWRIEKPSWELAGVVSVISTGLGLLVYGEAKFDALGFTLVMLASASSGVRFTLTQVSLHGHGGAVSMGGPLEVMELLMPVMSATTLLLSVSWEKLWVVLPPSPYFASLADVGVTLLIIFIGAVLAFLMVWTEFKVIQETSALTFMIAGTCKEVVTVIVAVLVFEDAFGAINGVGLGVVISGVVLFNYHKYKHMMQGQIRAYTTSRPDKLEDAEDGLELEPLVVMATQAQQPSALGLITSLSTGGDRMAESVAAPAKSAGRGAALLSKAGMPLVTTPSEAEALLLHSPSRGKALERRHSAKETFPPPSPGSSAG